MFRSTSTSRIARNAAASLTTILLLTIAFGGYAKPANVSLPPTAPPVPAATPATAKPTPPPIPTLAITITGAVSSPGPHSVKVGAHLNDAMLAAVPALDADLSDVRVEHKSTPDGTAEAVDFAAYLDKKVDDGNPPLTDGDMIDVPQKQGVPVDVNVRGDVVNPGRLSLTSPVTVVEAIAQAGGLTADADPSSIAIQHSGSKEHHSVDYALAAQAPQESEVDPAVLDGDTILVGQTSTTSTFTISGAVVHPGAYIIGAGTMTLADAMVRAGGPADHARLDKTFLLRIAKTGDPQKIELNAKDPTVQKNTTLQAGDEIIVPIAAPKTKMDAYQILGAAATVISVVAH